MDGRRSTTYSGEWDSESGSYRIKEGEDWVVSVCPMFFNDRILFSYRDEYPRTYSAGWCYDKGGAAVLAAQVWEPDTQHEPVGYKKVAIDTR